MQLRLRHVLRESACLHPDGEFLLLQQIHEAVGLSSADAIEADLSLTLTFKGSDVCTVLILTLLYFIYFIAA